VDEAGSATAARADACAASGEMAHIATMEDAVEGDGVDGREMDCSAASNPDLERSLLRRLQFKIRGESW
jgi:hypothetical protein